ncbi:hypothetical protein [Chlamydia felis Fe/C-56]|uniref:Uncharacterized protein n=1 Tax=Chlamydia felis (strain Fe/C-56) TaxID=264202 RepID=Q254E2_CHLFF|nr:DUF1389 domain-containing protein [Chlamydia felis]BAE81346.1 hypothetical protein [Chlamydia felis Fe/C-56]
MKASDLFSSQALPKQEAVCRYMHSKRPKTYQLIVLIVVSILFIISGLICLSVLPSSINLTVSLILASLGWCILSFVTAQIIIKYSQPKNLRIPLGFRRVIKANFPRVFYDLVSNQDLSIIKLRELVCFMDNFGKSQNSLIKKNLHKLSPQLRNNLEAFGIDNFDIETNLQELPDLDKLLIDNSPLYWMKHFIELGSNDVLSKSYEKNEKQDRRYLGDYWFSDIGFIYQSLDGKKSSTIFNLHMYGVVQELNEKDYSCLMTHARNNTWDHQDVSVIVDRLIISSQGDYSRYTKDKEQVISGNLRVEFTEEELRNLLLRICLHGFSWDQLQLIRSVSISSWLFLSWIDESFLGGGGMKKLARRFLGDFINESSLNYEPSIALSTYSELKNVTQYKKLMNQRFTNACRTICFYFNHQTKFHKKLMNVDTYLNKEMNSPGCGV